MIIPVLALSLWIFRGHRRKKQYISSLPVSDRTHLYILGDILRTESGIGSELVECQAVHLGVSGGPSGVDIENGILDRVRVSGVYDQSHHLHTLNTEW